jgi:tetratricopeptide (TPR) repeat protein
MFAKKEITEVPTHVSTKKKSVRTNVQSHAKPDAEKDSRTRTFCVGDMFLQTVLVTFVFLLPLFFLPMSIASLATAKMYFTYVVGVILLAAFLVRTLQKAAIELPFNMVVLTGTLVLLGYIVAGIFSQNVPLSFFGRDFAQDSIMAVAILFGLTSVVAIIAKNSRSSIYVYTALMISGGIVAIVHLLNLLVPALPAFGIFSSNIASTLGKWNDLGLFAALILMITIVALEHITFAKLVRMFLYVSVVLNGLLLVFVNFALAWWLLGIFAVFVLVQTFVRGHKQDIKKLSIRALVLLVLCGSFLVVGQPVGAFITKSLNIQHLEVRPSLEATVTLTQQALTGSRTFVGVGPALFENVWPALRPASITTTNFWNVDFRYGFGLLPTFVITTGVIGGVSWVLLLLSLVWVSVRALRTPVERPQDLFLLTTGGTTMWFLLLVLTLYLPSTALVVLTVVCMGLFLGTAARLKVMPVATIPVSGKALTLGAHVVVILLLIGVLGIGVQATVKFIAHTYFQKSITVLAATNDSTQVEGYLATAVWLDGIDTYHRSLSEVGTAKLNSLITNASAEAPMNQEVFGAVANQVIENYNRAIAYDPRNYNNYLGLAYFYTGLTTIGIENVYEVAKQLYSKALELNPNNPGIHLALARLELARPNVPEARTHIDRAIELKPNYSEAYLLLTQLELSQGSRDRAVDVMRRAGAANPNDPFTYFQLGLLEYDNKKFDQAVFALERAVGLNPGFQNAKYFLGLSYFEMGAVQASIKQFVELAVLNPSNTDLQKILENLRAGRAPIAVQQTLETLELPLADDTESAEETGELESVE